MYACVVRVRVCFLQVAKRLGLSGPNLAHEFILSEGLFSSKQ